MKTGTARFPQVYAADERRWTKWENEQIERRLRGQSSVYDNMVVAVKLEQVRNGIPPYTKADRKEKRRAHNEVIRSQIEDMEKKLLRD